MSFKVRTEEDADIIGLKKYAQVEEATGEAPSDGEILYHKEKLTWLESFKFKTSKFIVKYKNIIIVVSIILANILYISCDEMCPYFNDEDCVMKFMLPKAPFWAAKLVTTAVVFVSIILLGFFYKRIHMGFSIWALINLVYLTSFYDNTIDHRKYGQVFGLFVQILVGCMFFFFFVFKSISYCFKKKPLLTAIGWPVAIITAMTIFYFSRVHDSCSHWDKGLGGESMDNGTPYCKIVTPKVCGYDIIDGMMDLSVFMNCENSSPNYDLMRKWYGNEVVDAPIIGFPRMEFAPKEFRVDDKLQSYVFSNLVPLKSTDDPKAKNLEIFIDQRNKDHVNVVIDLKKNDTLIEERSKIKKDTLTKNVLIVYIDTLSRARIYKKLKKTMKWLEKFYNEKSTERESFQFFKYHSITPYTQDNLLAAFHGVKAPTDIKKHIPAPPTTPVLSYITQFKEAGFITGRALDLCDSSLLFIDRDLKNYVQDVPFDHEGSTISCDPQYYPPNSHLGMWVGPYSDIRRCLYGKDMYEYIFEYGNQFWNTYSNQKKFFYAEFIDAHESTQENIRYLDEPLVAFLEGLEKQKALDDTLIMFWSDHGLHLPSFTDLIASDTKAIERGLPMLFLVLPRTISQQYRVAVKSNQNKLVSAWQVHELFMSIPEGKKSTHLSTSMLGELPNLTCEDISVKNQPCFCNY